ncbi:hypothetical protein CDAR_397621 [Caerostris darwini]|uniref:Uncharacterized protein n=1 Tax=Caerostris darwini TaxID=1538125 RepID=A0AAV4TAJ1_9ARAC|nr:hypothetical protein CDAR_397621 [Caerostris darwini]
MGVGRGAFSKDVRFISTHRFVPFLSFHNTHLTSIPPVRALWASKAGFTSRPVIKQPLFSLSRQFTATAKRVLWHNLSGDYGITCQLFSDETLADAFLFLFFLFFFGKVLLAQDEISPPWKYF